MPQDQGCVVVDNVSYLAASQSALLVKGRSTQALSSVESSGHCRLGFATGLSSILLVQVESRQALSSAEGRDEAVPASSVWACPIIIIQSDLKIIHVRCHLYFFFFSDEYIAKPALSGPRVAILFIIPVRNLPNCELYFLFFKYIPTIPHIKIKYPHTHTLMTSQ